MDKKTLKSQTIIKTVIILGILILLNIISVRIFGRIDLTENNLYTLSDASKNLIKMLDDRLTVKAYITDDLPAPYNNTRRVLLDMLNEYKAYSKGNLQYEFISPEGEEGEKEAQSQGIPPVEVQIVKEDKVEVKRAYLGVVMLYEDKKEVLPVVQNPATLEYDISSSVKKLIQKDKKTIGYATGHLEREMDQLKVAEQELMKQYDVERVDLSDSAKVIPGDIDVLLIIDPKTPYNDTAKYVLDDYLMRGGKIALLAGKTKIDPQMQNLQAQLAPFGLDDILANWGIKINTDLVRDARCATIGVVRQQGQFQIQSQVQFPNFPLITNFNQDNIITKGLQAIVLQFPSSIDTSIASQHGIKAQVIAYSSEASGRQTGQIMISPFTQYTENDFPEQYIPLAVVYSGQFDSFFEGKQPAPKRTRSLQTQLIVVSTGQFVEDNALTYRDNPVFFTNIVDYLADDAGLISIRTKNVTIPPLEEVADGTKKMLKYGNMILPPVLVVLFGLFRWRRRQVIKRMIESQI